LLQIIKIVLII